MELPLEPKTIEMKLFGEKIVFTERRVMDVFSYMELGQETMTAPTNAQIYQKSLYMAVMVITDCLKPYMESLSYPKRRKLKKKMSGRAIMKKMSPAQVIGLSKKLLKELEGIDLDEQEQELKKKMKELSE